MRIGNKKLSFDISISKGKRIWHTGNYTLAIYKEHWDKEEKEWVSNWWKFIPIGRRIK